MFKVVKCSLLWGLQTCYDSERKCISFSVEANGTAQYTYLLSIPLIMIYSFGFTYIKYAEGFLYIGGDSKSLNAHSSNQISDFVQLLSSRTTSGKRNIDV